MIVAGFGCRPGAPVDDFLAAFRLALKAAGCDWRSVVSLAVPHFRAAELRALGAWETLGLSVAVVDQEALADACVRAETHSALAHKHTGISSVAESAALAVAGEGSRLLARRTSAGAVTCAIAIWEDFG